MFSNIIELGIPEFGMGIKRVLIHTDKLSPISNALRIGNFLIGGSQIADGIIVCPVDERIEAEVAHSVDFEVHKHMEL